MKKPTKTSKKRRIKPKKNYLGHFSFPQTKKPYYAIGLLIFLFLFSLNFSFLKDKTKNLIHTVFAAPIDLGPIVASSGADINLGPGTYSFTGDLTIPAGKTLHYERGAIITINVGQTLFINGGMDDHLYKIFDDKNTDLDKGVKFSSGNILNVRPEWWGARVDDIPPVNVGQYKTINSVAIEKAVNSHIDHVTNVIFASGSYYIDKPIVLRGNISLYGSGMQDGSGSQLSNANQVDMPYIITDSLPIDGKQGGTIKGLALGIRATSFDPIDLIHFANGTSNWNIEDNNFNVPTSGAHVGIAGDPGWGIYLNGISDVTIKNNRSYVYRTGLMYLKGSNIKVISNEVQNGAVEAGVHLDHCEKCNFENNIFFADPSNWNSVAQKNGLIVEESPSALVQNNRIDGAWSGIKVIGAGGSIKNNALIANWKYGIEAENISNTAIESNRIYVSPQWQPPSINAKWIGDYGIKLGQIGDNVTIKNNNISGWKMGSISYDPGGTGAHTASIEKNTGSDVQGQLPILGSGATPSVAVSDNWVTNNSSGIALADFLDAPIGKEIFVEFGDANTTVKFSGSNLQGNGGADWTPSIGDHMRCKKMSSYWSCNCFDDTP